MSDWEQLAGIWDQLIMILVHCRETGSNEGVLSALNLTYDYLGRGDESRHTFFSDGLASIVSDFAHIFPVDVARVIAHAGLPQSYNAPDIMPILFDEALVVHDINVERILSYACSCATTNPLLVPHLARILTAPFLALPYIRILVSAYSDHPDWIDAVRVDDAIRCAVIPRPCESSALMTTFVLSRVLPLKRFDEDYIDRIVFMMLTFGYIRDFVRFNAILLVIIEDIFPDNPFRSSLVALRVLARSHVFTHELLRAISRGICGASVGMVRPDLFGIEEHIFVCTLCTRRSTHDDAIAIVRVLIGECPELYAVAKGMGILKMIDLAHLPRGLVSRILTDVSAGLSITRYEGKLALSGMCLAVNIDAKRILHTYSERMRCPCSNVACGPDGSMRHIDKLTSCSGRLPTEDKDWPRLCRAYAACGAPPDEYALLACRIHLASVVYGNSERFLALPDPYQARVDLGEFRMSAKYTSSCNNRDFKLVIEPVPRDFPDSEYIDCWSSMNMKTKCDISQSLHYVLPYSSQLISRSSSLESIYSAATPRDLCFVASIMASSRQSASPVLHFIVDDIFPSRIYSPPPRLSSRIFGNAEGTLSFIRDSIRGVLPLLSRTGVATLGTTRHIVSQAMTSLMKDCGDVIERLWWPNSSMSEGVSRTFGILFAYLFALLSPFPIPIPFPVYRVVVGGKSAINDSDWVHSNINVGRASRYSTLSRMIGVQAHESFSEIFSEEYIGSTFTARPLCRMFSTEYLPITSEEFLGHLIVDPRDTRIARLFSDVVTSMPPERSEARSALIGAPSALGGGCSLLLPRTEFVRATVDSIRREDKRILFPQGANDYPEIHRLVSSFSPT